MSNINKSYSKNKRIFSIIKNIFFIGLSVAFIVIFWPWIKRVASTLYVIVPALRFILYALIVLYIVFTVSALKKRRSFIKKLKKYNEAKKCTISEIKSPYSSVIFRKKGESFVLNVKGKKYSCKLISFTNRFLPAIFNEDGYYYRISAKMLKQGLSPTFQSNKSFDYKSDLPKILILTSIPYTVLINNKNKMKPIDTGEICGEYLIYNKEGLFGAIERDCITFKVKEEQ